jgi:EpsD family peptidyl-prolyl cis-trans isomerase
MTVRQSFSHVILLGALFSIGLTACGHKSEGGATQVVAKVNGDEISIHQINFQLARLGAMDKEKSKVVAREVLSKLVNQELLKQKAIEAKLDRDPRVLQAIEASKNEILASVYLEQQMTKAGKPTPSEIEDFYKQNPALFEKRRIYSLAELAINAKPEQMQEVQSIASSGKTMNEIANELKAKNYELQANTNVKPAEQIPAGLLGKLQAMNDGDLVVVNTGRSINIVQVAKSEDQAIDLEKAKPIIERYFTNKNKNELAKNEMEQLNKVAKIEYLGDFADMKDGVKPKLADTKAESAPALKADSTENKEKKVLEKGISGL